MGEITVDAVDERDSSWEMYTPRFRVYLHGSGQSRTSGWTATYDITGADVLQVIDWAQREAGSTLTFAVALVVDDRARESGNTRGLVWLVGMDGNDVAQSPEESEIQARMLERRGDHVGVPSSDRIPEDTLGVGEELIARLNRIQPPQ